MDHYTRERFQSEDSIGFLINKARNLMVAELDSALKDLEITSQQMGILLAMKRGMASTPFELSRFLGIDTGLMTRMLDKLESKALLERSRSLEDRRVVNLTLTEKGVEVTNRIPDIAPAVLNLRLQSFNKEEFKEFGRLLRKFLEH